jgi:hypothetical protein
MLKNTRMKQIAHSKLIVIIIGLFSLIPFSGISQSNNKVLHSNKRTIRIYEGNRTVEWVISPKIKPDVFELYDKKIKKKTVKFVSDIDSIEFTVKLNKPVNFIILLKNDTAHTQINFTNILPNTISSTDKLLSLSMFWSEAKYNFASFDQLTFDWDSLYKSYIPLILETKNDVEYSEVMRNFVSSLQDGHTNFSPKSYKYPYCDFIQMTVKFFEDTLQITTVRSTLADIFPLGSKIIRINGINADEYMQEHIFPYVNSKFKPTQQELAARKLVSLKQLHDELTLTYITPQGEIRTNTPPRDGTKNRSARVGKDVVYDRELVHISWIDTANIAVLTINTFDDDDRIDLISTFEKIKDTLYHADGIIIDIRQNGGGSTSVAKHFIKYIVKTPWFLGIGAETRLHNAVKKAQGNYFTEWEDFYKMRVYEKTLPDTVFIADTIKRFECPIAVLFSTFTVSAAEDFLIMLYERSDRPLFIGQPSYGSTGAPLVIWDWPIDDSFARICARRVLFPHSLKPFSEGIIPDIWVKYSFEEYMSGKDKDMEVAVKELEKQINNVKKRK